MGHKLAHNEYDIIYGGGSGLCETSHCPCESKNPHSKKESLNLGHKL
jgi:hypothetical protein